MGLPPNRFVERREKRQAGLTALGKITLLHSFWDYASGERASPLKFSFSSSFSGSFDMGCAVPSSCMTSVPHCICLPKQSERQYPSVHLSVSLCVHLSGIKHLPTYCLADQLMPLIRDAALNGFVTSGVFKKSARFCVGLSGGRFWTTSSAEKLEQNQTRTFPFSRRNVY